MNTADAGDAASAEAGDVVHEGLTRLAAMDGLVSACLVEIETGHVLDTLIGSSSAGQDASWSDANAARMVAAGASDIVHVIRLMTSSLGGPDGLEDVIVTLGQHHHILRPLPRAGIDGLLVVVTLDRTATNLALARRQLRGVDATPARHATQDRHAPPDGQTQAGHGTDNGRPPSATPLGGGGSLGSGSLGSVGSVAGA